jgi:hypothetical protein
MTGRSLHHTIATMIPIEDFPSYFRDYAWQDKHALYGYPGDTFDASFPWIGSLERRFAWLKMNHTAQQTSSVYLVREMIQWGGSQNGTLQKFDDGQGEVNLYDLLADTIGHLGTPELALRAALNIPGMGLTYASKLLRFLDPEIYGALDGRVRDGLDSRKGIGLIPIIRDSSVNSMVSGYLAFLTNIATLRQQLDTAGIERPECALQRGRNQSGWRAADIEMAIFQWTAKRKGKRDATPPVA